MPQLHLDEDIINILLLGRDTSRDSRSYRTDVIIIASVNKKENAVTLLPIPRDLYVYIPGWTMQRINTAANHGDAIGYQGGGVALLEQTILYNFGIPIHGWARIDFGGFAQVVDILGGVDLPVTCIMQDWRLKDEGYALTDQDPDHWELYTVDPGIQHMGGSLALWYARSRKHSSDFDRSRRQHQVLRAILDKALQLDLLPKVPQLYGQYAEIVDTDLGLGDLLQFVPLATAIDRSRIKSRFVGRGYVTSWTAPDGAAVLLPNRAAIASLLDEAFLPPADNVLARAAPAVEIWNGTRHKNWEILAADNLEWAGIVPVINSPDATNYTTTLIYDFSTNAKTGAYARKELQRIFHVKDAQVITAPDANAAQPFRVVLGESFDSCVAPMSVVIRQTETPNAPASTTTGSVVRAAPIVGPPPRVDGDLSEWTVLEYSAGVPTFGRENWSGAADLSAVWNLAWSETHLYLALKVRDDVLSQENSGSGLYKGDSVELLLNINPSNTGALDTDDFQLGVSSFSGEAYLWLPKEFASSVGDVTFAWQQLEDGYAVELAVPWSVFRVKPEVEQTFGFTLSINDNDTPGTPRQETLVTHNARRKLTEPSTWVTLVLSAP